MSRPAMPALLVAAITGTSTGPDSTRAQVGFPGIVAAPEDLYAGSRALSPAGTRPEAPRPSAPAARPGRVIYGGGRTAPQPQPTATAQPVRDTTPPRVARASRSTCSQSMVAAGGRAGDAPTA